MRNIFINNNSAHRTWWSARRQRRRLPEHARITFYDIKIRAVVATTEPQATLRYPAPVADALHGPYFTSWARYRRIICILVQQELIKDRAYMDSVVDLPQQAGNRARSLLTGACNGFLQVSETRCLQ